MVLARGWREIVTVQRGVRAAARHQSINNGHLYKRRVGERKLSGGRSVARLRRCRHAALKMRRERVALMLSGRLEVKSMSNVSLSAMRQQY